MEKYGFVYIWYDRKHKRYYIGCRWGHENDGYICSSPWMKQAYKRRPEDFKRRILSKIYTNKKDLLEEEYKWLNMIKSEELGKRYYNLHNHKFNHWSSDGDKSKSVSQKSAETQKKNLLEKQKNDPNWKHWNKGRVRSEETKQKIREARAKQVITEETKKKMSESLKGEKNPFFGKKHSDETKEKNRVAHLGKKASKETKTKLSLAKLGEKNHFYGKKHSEDSRRKMSESQQRRFSKSI